MNGYKTFGLYTVLALFSLALPGCATSPNSDDSLAGPDRLKQLEVRRTGPDYLIRITGDQKPTYTVFRLFNPMRIVVDLANYDVRPLAKPRLIQTGDIARIRGRQFGDDSLGIGRLEVTLRSLADFDSWVDGDSVVIQVKPARVDTTVAQSYTQSDDGILFEDEFEGDDVLLEEEFIDDVADDELFGETDDFDDFGDSAEEAAVEEAAPAVEAESIEPEPAVEEAEEVVSEEMPVEEPVLAEPEATELEETEDVIEAAPAVPAEPVLEEPATEIAEPEFGEEIIEQDEFLDEPIVEAPPVVAEEPVTDEPVVEEPVIEEALPIIEETDPDEQLAQDTLEGVDSGVIEAAEQPVVPVQASQLVDVSWAIEPGATIINIDANGPFGDYNAFKLEDPARIVVDVWNVDSLIPGEQFSVGSEQVSNVRVGVYPEKVRIAIDVPGIQALPFEAQKSGSSLTVKLMGTPAQKPEIVAQVVEPEPVIEVEAEEPAEVAEVIEPAPKAAVKPAMPMPVVEPTKPSVPAKTTPKQEAVEPMPVASQQKNVGAQAIDIRLDATAKKTAPTATGKRYEGRRMSLDFKDADIDSVLRLIAEVSSLNIVTDEEVSGTISLRLVNVPWDQALDVVLGAKQLGMRKLGNIVRVAPAKKLSEEDEQRLKSLEDQELLLPLYIRVVPVNFADAANLAARLTPLLSTRGKVDVDKRTNVLIVKDIERNLEDAISLVRSLDSPTPQVLIEAKIVEANTTFTRELGVQWGYGQQMAPEFGNRNLPGRVGIAGNASNGLVGPAAAGSGDPNFAVDLPAAVGQGSGGALGFVFGSLDNSTILDLRLTALEASGEGRIISSPRITTLDNEKAKITQGISIPFQTVSADGTQTQFVDAALSLEVTPHITPDRSVLLEFKISKNAPDQTFTAGTGVPSISKKEAESRMLVSDGETAVVGGIFTMDQGSNVAAVPWLSKIPVLGWFFKKRSSRETKTELLLFVTPRVVVD